MESDWDWKWKKDLITQKEGNGNEYELWRIWRSVCITGSKRKNG